jgi:hypothetical protein
VSEFKDGLNIDNYTEVIKHDDYNLIEEYLEKMNTEKNFIFQRHEANLLILGNLTEDLKGLREREMLDDSLMDGIIDFLIDTISKPMDRKTI